MRWQESMKDVDYEIFLKEGKITFDRMAFI